MSRRLRWLAPPAVVLALGGAFLLWPTRPARDGDVIAAEPRVVSIGEGAVAELSSGAHVSWSGDEVQQDRGEVTYRVQPGAPFRVQTPFGGVAALGTIFRVVVTDPNEAGGESMKKRWAVAGASVTLGVLLFVSVERGRVRLATAEHELVLDAGKSGSVGPDGIPLRADAAPSAPADASRFAEGDSARTRARQVADAVRRHAARRRTAARGAQEVSPERPAPEETRSEPAAAPIVFGPAAPGSPPVTAPPATAEEARRRDYIRRTVREQYFPVARDCYQELLDRQPSAGGRFVLEFAIVGDGDAGVVDRVVQRDDHAEDTIDDPEFALCMSESLYTAVFEPPPPGVSETTIVYPVVLAPE